MLGVLQAPRRPGLPADRVAGTVDARCLAATGQRGSGGGTHIR